MSELQGKLPEVQLNALAERITKGSTPTSYGYEYKAEGIKFIKAENINAFGYATTTSSYIDDETHEFLSRSKLKENDLLFSIAGTIGRVGIVRDIDLPANTNQALAIIRLAESTLDIKYLFYYLNSPMIQKTAINNVVGVGRANLSLKNIGEFKIPIVPLDQQKRIVAKIEELFSHIDAGVDGLKKTQRLLKQYRQSVLKAAVTGELTREWREENKDKLEPASELLKKILEARRRKWEEQQLEDFKAKEKIPKDESWINNYQKPSSYNGGGYKIPDKWIMVRAEEICGFITKGTTPQKDKLNKEQGIIPFIKVYNLAFDTALDFKTDPTFTDLETHNGFLARSKVYPGDVLMNIVGPPLGKVSIAPKTYDEWNINQAIALYRPVNGMNNKLLAYFLLSKPILDWMLSKTKTTVGQVNLTLEISRNVPIPIMSEKEQCEIIRQVEEKLFSSDRLLKEIDKQLNKAVRNKQSILATAFSGNFSTEKVKCNEY